MCWGNTQFLRNDRLINDGPRRTPLPLWRCSPRREQSPRASVQCPIPAAYTVVHHAATPDWDNLTRVQPGHVDLFSEVEKHTVRLVESVRNSIEGDAEPVRTKGGAHALRGGLGELRVDVIGSTGERQTSKANNHIERRGSCTIALLPWFGPGRP